MHLSEVPLARATLAELGEDYSAADFFEKYAANIEELAQTAQRITPEVRQLLLDVLTYFQDPPENVQSWSQPGLRALAMLTPLGVAAGVLAAPREALDVAVATRLPNKPWVWWNALGKAILTGRPTSEIAEVFGLTPYGVRKYTRFLVGPLSATTRAA